VANANADKAKKRAALCVRITLPWQFLLAKGVSHTHMDQEQSYHIDDAFAAANAEGLPPIPQAAPTAHFLPLLRPRKVTLK